MHTWAEVAVFPAGLVCVEVVGLGSRAFLLSIGWAPACGGAKAQPTFMAEIVILVVVPSVGLWVTCYACSRLIITPR